MSFSEGFTKGAALCEGKSGINVFDWTKAARLIKEKKPELVEAGLNGDFECTGGRIYEGGKLVPKDETYTYLASCWAIPTIVLDGVDEPCFYREDEEPRDWDANTYWPEEARKILGE